MDQFLKFTKKTFEDKTGILFLGAFYHCHIVTAYWSELSVIGPSLNRAT